MSTTDDIDNNDEALFQFDPFDSHQSLLVSSSPQLPWMSPGRNHPAMSAHPASLPSDLDNGGDGPTDGLNTNVDAKGKARTMPMPIRQMIVRDLFEVSSQKLSSPMSYDSSSSVMICSPSTSHFSSDSNSLLRRHCSFLTEDMEQSHSLNPVSESYAGKGKQKAPFPMLPPLTFSNIDFDYDQNIPLTPGPSSYGTSPTMNDNAFPPSSAISVTDIPISSPSPIHSSEAGVSLSNVHVSRCQSLTNLSHQALPPSGSPSTAVSSAASNLSRQLLEIFDKTDNTDSVAIDPTSLLSTLDLQVIPGELDNHLPAWYIAAKTSDAKSSSRERENFKPKRRSRSSPYPISALDIIPDASTDIFQPLPIVILNYFDLVLPKELRLLILRALVELHEDDHQRSILERRFTVAKATSSRGRWVGRDKGIRELFKLSRVSKTWQALIFDGQLWANLDLHSFPGLPQETIIRTVQSSGSFIRSLDFAGHTNLSPDTMSYLTNDLCFKNPNLPLSYNQLASVNLQGCTSLTTRSLHQLLVRSRGLESLSLKGLNAVTNTTCDIISNFCPNLISLNMNRCLNMDAEGIKSLALRRRDYLKLRELRLSGLKNVSDMMMSALGQAAPFLEVLELSYSRQLHNSAIDAFVACDEELHACRTAHVDTVLVAARDLGREASDFSSKMIRRRVTRLRHLLLSHCTMLTDFACANLAYSVPKLEILELAGIGPELRDAGLITLLRRTPFIRRLDLEDASEITDAVIRTVTPAPEIQENPGSTVLKAKQPGHILQHLNISYAKNIFDDALLTLIRNCNHLTVLEADNTRIGKTVIKEFVRISRQRRATNARIVAIDCRGINESLVKELSPMTRPRLAFRRYDARKLNYLDARDDNEDELKVGQDECDEDRVVIKTFYSWQTVDAVKAIRDKRRKSMGRKMGSESSNGAGSEIEGAGGTRGGRRSGYTRWWSPGRRSRNSTANSGNVSPILPEMNGADGCLVM